MPALLSSVEPLPDWPSARAYLPDEHPIVRAGLIEVLGRIEVARASHPSAIKAFRACLDLRAKTLSPDHWLIAATNSSPGECMVHLGDRAAGERLLRNSRDFLQRRLGPDHEITLQAEARIRNALS